MKQDRLLHAAVLIIILVGGTATFWYAKGDTNLQLIVGSLVSAAYVAWGIIHHALIGDLHRKIVIEYVLVGLIAVVLLATVAL